MTPITHQMWVVAPYVFDIVCAVFTYYIAFVCTADTRQNVMYVMLWARQVKFKFKAERPAVRTCVVFVIVAFECAHHHVQRVKRKFNLNSLECVCWLFIRFICPINKARETCVTDNFRRPGFIVIEWTCMCVWVYVSMWDVKWKWVMSSLRTLYGWNVIVN